MSTVIILQNGGFRSVSAEKGTNLLTLLRQNGIYLQAPCGGRGTCGKCRVLLRDGQGERTVRACQTEIGQDCTVLLPQGESDVCLQSASGTAIEPRHGFGAAVDVGTTTVALHLYDLQTGALLGAAGEENAQCAYGADVVTRLEYVCARPEGSAQLHRLIAAQVSRMLAELAKSRGLTEQDVTELCVAGNTVMQHLLAGISPASMAAAPFAPATLFAGEPLRAVAPLPIAWFSPCVSAYVGGDIVAGLYASGAWTSEVPVLFLDIGTNGEMALGNRDGFLCCAVACGPAFEGAEISCGMTCRRGAIRHVRWEDGLVFDVAEDVDAAGICGSGLIDLLAVLLRLGAVDQSGRLLPPEEAPAAILPWLGEDDDGNGRIWLSADHSVYFSAGDVRKLQLAKAAVAAGITVLLERAGLSPGQIGRVCLSGGFGSRIDPASAAAVGMIPPELAARIDGVGNSALSGAAAALCAPSVRENMERIRQSCRLLELSGDASFQKYFLEQMLFDDEN